MGQRLIALAREAALFTVVAAIVRPESDLIGRDAGELAGVGQIGCPITFDCRATPDVMIDFSSPPAMRHWLAVCRDRGIAMVIGTTGLAEQDQHSIDRAAEQIAVLHAGNMSLGVTVMCRLVAEAARLLGPEYDCDIAEMHHRYKKDAPSGTALMIADAILHASGRSREDLRLGRAGTEATRVRGELGMHSLRVGDEVGTHTAYFGAPGERIEITHKATTRDTFAHGALRAAAWIKGKPPGRYSIQNVLGLG